jgi:hypothetical protein
VNGTSKDTVPFHGSHTPLWSRIEKLMWLPLSSITRSTRKTSPTWPTFASSGRTSARICTASDTLAELTNVAPLSRVMPTAKVELLAATAPGPVCREPWRVSIVVLWAKAICPANPSSAPTAASLARRLNFMLLSPQRSNRR